MTPATRVDVNLDRWPALARPLSPPLRTAAARMFLCRAAAHCGIRLEDSHARVAGPPFGPLLRAHDLDAMAARIAVAGKIGFAESYMAGEWDAPDLVGVLESLARGVWTAVPRPLAWLRRLTEAKIPDGETNNLPGARRNIASHYDLSDDLFETFLDETMTYSSALFDPDGSPNETLAAAQQRKIDRLLNAAEVQGGTRLLEIGTGWGALALGAARRGAKVTTVTLSENQASLARRRALDAGMAATIDVQVADYRQVRGTFDAIVSVEMIEAVGPRWWPVYFGCLEGLLARHGKIGLQAIVMDHRRMLDTSRSWTWTRKYIFPGGTIPSLIAIRKDLAAYTDLHIVDEYHFGESYAKTLEAWGLRFAEQTGQVHAIGFDDVFERMWRFYLAQSEAAFRTGYLDVVQLVVTR
jgi:cyclopropane-fatty-acyl-phospholipid synthase